MLSIRNTSIENSRASIEKEDLYKLHNILTEQKIKPKNVLEIGAWRGYSLRLWYELFHPDNMCTIEKEGFYLLDYLVEKAGFPGTKVLMCYGHDSQEEQVFNDVKAYFSESHSPVDFLFIDGDHHYEAVKHDFEKYHKLMLDSGVVVFHDALETNIEGVEVNRLWNELKGNYQSWEIKESPKSTGIGIILL